MIKQLTSLSISPNLSLLGRLIVVASLMLAAAHPAAALDAVSIQLKWKHQFQFAGYYQALEQGFYRDANLDVTIREGGPEIDVPAGYTRIVYEPQYVLSADKTSYDSVSGTVQSMLLALPVTTARPANV